MRSLISALVLAGFSAACGGGMTPEQANRQLDQMMTLYKDNRPKFVVQKQEMEQGACERATLLRQAADNRVSAAAMSPEDNETLTMVQMELSQAEKTCLSR